MVPGVMASRKLPRISLVFVTLLILILRVIPVRLAERGSTERLSRFLCIMVEKKSFLLHFDLPETSLISGGGAKGHALDEKYWRPERRFTSRAPLTRGSQLDTGQTKTA